MNANEIIVDSFAGGGGASLGISWALGRSPDIAINHDKEAIALHAANHADSLHLSEDVWQVDPVQVCAGRPVGLMWLSPDCKHFSKAKGDASIRQVITAAALAGARASIHYVPSAKYEKPSFGDERLMPAAEWYLIGEPSSIIEFNDGYDLVLIWNHR